MSALESPVEALALSYSSFGFLKAVNSVWTWIAVITTAAVSIWRIRVASSPRVKSLDDTSAHLTWLPSLPAPPVERVAAEPQVSTSSKSTVSAPVFEREGRTSGKFTLYYREDEDDYGNDDISNDGNGGRAVDCDDREESHWLSDGNWEAMMKLRMGNMGWYSYQDLTVLDGSVVRLWNGGRRRRTTSLVTCGGEGVVT